MKFSCLLDGLNCQEYVKDVEISNVSSDSRLIQAGGLFVCIDGLKADGHDFIREAVANGAAVVVGQKFLEDVCPVPYVRVDDSRSALAFICNNFYEKPSQRLDITAVTGTNGKTTTVHMLKAIFDEAVVSNDKTALMGTVTNSLTTPDPEQLYPELKRMADSGVQYLFMEASSHALALGKLDPIYFNASIFTNLSPEHLDFHNSMEEYFKAKAKLFFQTKFAFINADDEYGKRLLNISPAENYSFSTIMTDSDYTAKNIKTNSLGVAFDFITYNRMFKIYCPAQGIFTVYNALAAASCAYRLGVEPYVIQAALRKFKAVSGRLERIQLTHSDLMVFIDFAHTPDALENVLKSMRDFMPPSASLTLLFGCGGDRDVSKRQIMGSVASRLADFVIITSDNSRSEEPSAIIRDILKGIDKERPFTVIPDRKEAILFALKNASAGDYILLAGKGHETYEINRNGKFPFSEKDIVLNAED